MTNETFWDDFWRSVTLPALIDERIQWQSALAKTFRKHLPADPSLKLLEIGCAPGRWLVWFRKNLGYQVAGCDNSPRGIDITRKNLESNGMKTELYAEDLQRGSLPREAFDIVLSLGVIEHFKDPMEIVMRHLELLKPGGTLVLEVPNMAGRINHWLLRKSRMNELLTHHNLDVMRQDFFLNVAEKFNLQIKLLDYVGGFDPGMVVHNHSQKSLWGRPMILYFLGLLEKLFRSISFLPRIFINYNDKNYSNMLLAIMVKPRKATNLKYES